tara:strand:- start:306 stop:992 length:687 start_codon:yes stop_codon:yes gene_type:complete
MSVIYNISNFFQRVALNTFADYKVVGQEKIPLYGPLLVVANHQSNFDPPLVATSIGRRVRFLAKESIFQGPNLVSWFLTQYGAYPLDRKGVGLNAYRWAIDQLARDQVIVIFPEGTRSRAGMKRALPGVTKLALDTQAAILPVGITGTEGFGHWMRVFNPTGTIRVNIGEAFYLPSLEGKISKEVLRSLTDMIMKRIAELLPSNYHGIYKDTERSNKVGLISEIEEKS